MTVRDILAWFKGHPPQPPPMTREDAAFWIKIAASYSGRGRPSTSQEGIRRSTARQKAQEASEMFPDLWEKLEGNT